jgi:hypothetical protein
MKTDSSTINEAQTAAKPEETVQWVRGCRRAIQKTFSEALDCREVRRWIRTEKPLNSNSLIGTTNAFCLSSVAVKILISISNHFISPSCVFLSFASFETIRQPHPGRPDC